MKESCPDYGFITSKPSFFMQRLSESYMGACEAKGIAKQIVNTYQGEELVKYLGELLMQAYIEIKDAQRGSRKGVDINIRISSDGVTAKVEKQ